MAQIMLYPQGSAGPVPGRGPNHISAARAAMILNFCKKIAALHMAAVKIRVPYPRCLMVTH